MIPPYKKLITSKLINYGFIKENNCYFYQTSILDNEFNLIVKINLLGDIETQLIDKETLEEYSLYKTSSRGTFITKIKEKIDLIINDIISCCFEIDIYKSKQAKEIIEYISSCYGDMQEFLWDKFPSTSIYRRKDNKKWYAALMCIKASKLNLNYDQEVEVILLRTSNIKEILSKPNHYIGYHFNKKNWFSIILNDSISTNQIKTYIDISYSLANKKYP